MANWIFPWQQSKENRFVEVHREKNFGMYLLRKHKLKLNKACWPSHPNRKQERMSDDKLRGSKVTAAMCKAFRRVSFPFLSSPSKSFWWKGSSGSGNSNFHCFIIILALYLFREFSALRWQLRPLCSNNEKPLVSWTHSAVRSVRCQFQWTGRFVEIVNSSAKSFKNVKKSDWTEKH